MKLTVPKGNLILPEDFSFELTFNHPFFSDEGSSSIPVEIPACPENLAMLDYPQRLMSTKQYSLSFDATLISGTLCLHGQLIVGGVTKDSISCVLALQESTMYSSFKEKRLREILKPYEKAIGHIATRTNPTTIEDLIGLHIRGIDSLEHEYPGTTAFTIEVTPDNYGFHIINELDDNGNLIYSERAYTNEDGNSMIVPHACGCSIFLYLWKMLELVFLASGYNVRTNVFKNQPYDSLVVLHNCADALISDTFTYADLVPDISVEELLAWLKDKFGAYVCTDNKSVDICLINDLTSYGTHDSLLNISSYVDNNSISVSYAEVKGVEIDCDKSLEGAAPPSDCSLEEYLDSTGDRIFLYDDPKEQDIDYQLGLMAAGSQTALIPRQLAVFRRVYGLFTNDLSLSRLGSMAFKYQRKGKFEGDEFKTDDKFAPSVFHKDVEVPYVGDAIYYHSSVAEDTGAYTSQPIILCWECCNNETGHRYGSSMPHDFGVRFPLNPDGIYHMFWRGYNKLLRAGAPEIKIDCPILPFFHQSNRIDFSKKLIFGNMHVVLKSCSFAVSNQGVRDCKLTFFSLIPSAVNINDKDTFAHECLEWKPINNVPRHALAFNTFASVDGLSDYTDNDAPTDRPWHVGQHAKARLRLGEYTNYENETSAVIYYERFVAVFKDDDTVL